MRLTRMTQDWSAELITEIGGADRLTTKRRFPDDGDGHGAKAFCGLFRQQYQDDGYKIVFSNATTVVMEKGLNKVTLIARRCYEHETT